MPHSTAIMSHETNPADGRHSPRSAITATDRLATIYGHPGPYTTVYLATRPLLANSESDTARRWRDLRIDLEVQGAPLPALQAIDARLALPSPEHTSAIAVIAAADGTTVVDYGLEPPAHDHVVVDSLPYASPLLEWHQRRVAHLVVTIDNVGADIAVFGLDHYERFDTVDGQDNDLADQIALRAQEIDAGLIVLAGEPADSNSMADRVRLRVPATCRIVTEPSHIVTDDLADAAVRLVSDTTARTTVRHLRDLRFLASHGAAVDGTAGTIEALAGRTADLLLIHDDPDDQRRCWIGDQPQQISLRPGSDHNQEARLVDAAIRSAVLQDVPIHIIPTTGPTGPTDNTAVITARHEPEVGPSEA